MLPVDASVEFLIVRLFGTSTSWAEARHDRNTDSKPTTTHRTRLCMANPPSESPRRCSRMHRLSTTYVYAKMKSARLQTLASLRALLNQARYSLRWRRPFGLHHAFARLRSDETASQGGIRRVSEIATSKLVLARQFNRQHRMKLHAVGRHSG